MYKSRWLILFAFSFYLPLASVSGQTVPPCPGFNSSNNTNLACEIPTAIRSGVARDNSLSSLTPTLATQLSQLPNATAISGSAILFNPATQQYTSSTESLGTILTQRGETLGWHRLYLSLSYERFNFTSIDGFSLRSIPTVLLQQSASGTSVVDTIARTRIDLLVDQFAAVGSFGIKKWLDVTVIMPFSKVTLKSGSVTRDLSVTGQTGLIPAPGPFLAGSAFGVDDISVGLKANIMDGERNKIAVGSEVRLPTGDATNFLGTGAYGIKPYFIVSRTGKRITPNINLGYQWNGASVLSLDPNTGAKQNLPSSFLYSGGVDVKAVSRLTFNMEFLGQAVINGPRLALTSLKTPAGFFPTVANQSSTYAMNNVGVGFKYNPFRSLQITADTLFALDEGGLRSKVVPLVGISYRFSPK